MWLSLLCSTSCEMCEAPSCGYFPATKTFDTTCNTVNEVCGYVSDDCKRFIVAYQHSGIEVDQEDMERNMAY